MAAANSKRKAGGKMEFLGPAQTTFTSFMELANFSLSTYCPNWNNLSDPDSYILPPTFKFKNPDKSDEDIQAEKEIFDQKKEDGAAQQELSSIQRPVVDRWSDEGEFIVYQALRTLIQEKGQAPFLAIHGLNLGNLKCYLHQIFPHDPSLIRDRFKAMMREYDFVLIGPKTGIIVIEVKSSAFTKEKDFAAKNRNLPDQIVDAVKQLNSFDLKFLHACSGIQTPPPPGIQVRKILFTPNLEKSRHDKWYTSLDQVAKDRVDNMLRNITHWFKEDMTNPGYGQHPLYNTVQKILNITGMEILLEIFESYGQILAGLASTVILHDHQDIITISEKLLSTRIALAEDAEAVDRQDPLKKLNSLSQAPVGKKRQKIDQSIDPGSVISFPPSRMVLLTPEQQKALNGPNCQFIIGPAGSGKTIVLQAKAVELRDKGKSVLVFAPASYVEQYDTLLGSENESCQVSRWSGFDFLMDPIFLNSGLELPGANALVEKISDSGIPLQEILDYLVELCLDEEIDFAQRMGEWINKFDAVFIDDALDLPEPSSYDSDDVGKLDSLFFSLIMMMMAAVNSKMVWVALDSYLPGGIYDRIYRHVLAEIMESEQNTFVCASLSRVMRSSESVFKATYTSEISRRMVVMPKIGHKILGYSDFESSLVLDGPTVSPDHVELNLWERTKLVLDKFIKDGFQYGQLAVITVHDNQYSLILQDYFRQKCQEVSIPVCSVASRSLESPNGSMVVDTWNDVSSLEWPIVIVARVDSEAARPIKDMAAYQRYRACSRATMAVVEVVVYT